MSDYPKMLYRKGTENKLHGYDCDVMVVHGSESEERHRGEGWANSPAEAYGEAAETPDNGEAAGLRADLQAAAELLEEERAARQAAEEEVADLRAQLAAFDHDGDGKPGGARRGRPPKAESDVQE